MKFFHTNLYLQKICFVTNDVILFNTDHSITYIQFSNFHLQLQEKAIAKLFSGW